MFYDGKGYVKHRETVELFCDSFYKAKDTLWDAVLMGSVACTVVAKLNKILTNAINDPMCINYFAILHLHICKDGG